MTDKSDSDNQESKIGQFFDDKTVFITGATGFMGKVRKYGLMILRFCEFVCRSL